MSLPAGGSICGTAGADADAHIGMNDLLRILGLWHGRPAGWSAGAGLAGGAGRRGRR